MRPTSPNPSLDANVPHSGLRLVAGFIGGAVLALPTALGFTVAIIIKWRRAKATAAPLTNSDFGFSVVFRPTQ